MPLTVTPVPASGYVTVDVTGLTGPVVVSRATPGGAAVPVRNGDPFPSGVTSVNDRECPFGVPVTYTASYGTSQTATANTQLNCTAARLEHPGLSALGKWVQVVSDNPPTWESPSAVHKIIGRTYPLVTAQTMTARNGTLRLYCDNLAEVNELIGLAQSGLPILLRTPQPALLRDGWLQVRSISEDVSRPDLPGRFVEVAYQVAERPGGDAAGSAVWRWQELTTENATWAEVRNAYQTWALAVAGAPS